MHRWYDVHGYRLKQLLAIAIIIILAAVILIVQASCKPALVPSDSRQSGLNDNMSIGSIVQDNASIKSVAQQSATQELESEIISASDTSRLCDNYGNKAVIEGTVTELNELYDATEGNYLVTYFGNTNEHLSTDMPNIMLKSGEYRDRICEMGTDFRAIIKEGDLGKFANPCFYINRKIRLTGYIDLLHGAPIVRLNDPSQILFVDNPPPEPARDTLRVIVGNSMQGETPGSVWFRRSVEITNTTTEWGVEDVYYGARKILRFIPPNGYIYDCTGSTPVYQNEASPNTGIATLDFNDEIKDQDIKSDLSWKWVWLPSEPQL